MHYRDSQNAMTTKPKKKRVVSPETRAKMAEAQRLRWAKPKDANAKR